MANPHKIFVNLPVKDLEKSKAFFTGLGFHFNPKFSDDKAGCLVIGDDVFFMLLAEPYFKTFIKKEVADATRTTEAILALTCESKAKVDELVDKALAAGAKSFNETKDLGFMYNRSFQDPDGHLWEMVWMDPAAIG